MAQPRYYSEDEMAERQPLGAVEPSPPRHRQHQQPYQDSYYPPPSSQYQSRGRRDPSIDRLRAQRRYSQEPGNGGRATGPYAAPGAIPNVYGDSGSPHRGSPQRGSDRRSWGQGGQGTSYPPSTQRPSPQSTITPGADNFSNAAAGGMAGIALTVAEQNARESGLNAIHSQQPYQQQGHGQGYGERGVPPRGDYYPGDRNSRSSLQGLNAGPAGTGYATPGQRTPSRLGEIYTDDPYQNLSRHQDPSLGVVNPHDIIDDGDDGLGYARRGQRTSMLSLGSSHKGAAAAGGAVTGGVLGGLVSRNGSGGSLGNEYAPVNNGASGDSISGASGGGGIYNAAPAGAGGSKEWQAAAVSPAAKRGKKWKFIILIALAIVIIAAIVLGIVFGVVLKKHGGSEGAGAAAGGDSTATADGDTKANGDLGIDSSEIQALMNNPDLRKVFPGMDYTPLNTQYPECIHDPPSQNNITRDLAVLSQMTNVVRLYGTDCNQTQMLIHAVNQLQLQDKVKIWLGVWQDGNDTTNARQLNQMWDILDQYGDSYFKGVIVANEILFREQMTITSLGSLLEEVRHNLTSRGMSLPVATSDLGDKWTSALAGQSDAIMANIHPFFAGTKAS
ncbi:glycoside hydrolase superfamily, partial [Chaetomium tenue]